MTVLLAVVLSLFYLGSMAGLVAAGIKGADRRRLLESALAILFTLIAARALLPVQPLAMWSWVGAVALFGAALGLAIMRGRHLPWVQLGASRWNLLGSAFWVTVLLVLTGTVLWSLF